MAAPGTQGFVYHDLQIDVHDIFLAEQRAPGPAFHGCRVDDNKARIRVHLNLQRIQILVVQRIKGGKPLRQLPAAHSIERRIEFEPGRYVQKGLAVAGPGKNKRRPAVI